MDHSYSKIYFSSFFKAWKYSRALTPRQQPHTRPSFCVLFKQKLGEGNLEPCSPFPCNHWTWGRAPQLPDRDSTPKNLVPRSICVSGMKCRIKKKRSTTNGGGHIGAQQTPKWAGFAGHLRAPARWAGSCAWGAGWRLASPGQRRTENVVSGVNSLKNCSHLVISEKTDVSEEVFYSLKREVVAVCEGGGVAL